MKYPLHPAARIVFNSRFLVCLLCAGAFALACGPRSPTTAASPPGPASAPRPALATSLDVGVRDGVALVLHVTNTTDQKLELRFPSGQMHDFAILDAQGRELWRASAERMYTQSLQTTLLDPGETASYRDRWDPKGRTGTFTAVATLTSDNHRLEKRVEFTLP